ncbi:hypothetical protein [Marinomonas colpomeniae]|uniref:MAPEG family protein n=1 Tax=Marinomonas colpomeniae TaxID=2774408 RepID=A0ABR8NXJ4_9GAMM|nr:hypothetical protein [Marinomonas colpomeniae]MBD5770771.1 hypothetical protein [Marinomonas colpomeniae]
MDYVFVTLGNILKYRYSIIFKGGVVLIGIVFVAWSDTSFKLVEMEAKQNDLEFSVKMSTGASEVGTLNCKELVPTKEAVDCNSAQYYKEVLKPSIKLFNLVVDICLFLGLNMILLSIFGLIFKHSKVNLSGVLRCMLIILCLNAVFLLQIYY